MIMPEDLQCLKEIALKGGLKGPVWVSSQSLGGALGTSPQTASRRLQSLERHQLLSRSVNPDGQYVTVTRSGEEILRHEYADYCRVFGNGREEFILQGNVISGLGEGRYYMSLAPYVQQFAEKIGFAPYPGTLNIRLESSSLQVRKRLDQLEWVQIKGFSAEGRTFGDARCLPCRIDGIPCGIVIPGRTHYPDDVLELIAPVSLRESLRVKDMDEVKVEVAP
jgi:riboflavin kinase